MRADPTWHRGSTRVRVGSIEDHMQAPDVTVTADASHTRADRRLASLDGLRGLAALSIFVFHGWLYTMPEPSAT